MEGFDTLFKDNSTAHALSDKERRDLAFLIVEGEINIRNSMRHALVSLGFDNIADASDSYIAIQKMEEKTYTHLIFDSHNTKMPAKQFLATIIRMNRHIIALPSSYEPTVDDVFELLISGARGYIVKPFTSGSLDESIAWATKGEPISEAIHNTRSRNEALASLVLGSLDKLALVLKQSQRFDTAKREIPKRYDTLRRSMEIARTFSKGGDPGLRRSIIELSTERSSKNTNTGTARRRRKRRRISEIVEESSP